MPDEAILEILKEEKQREGEFLEKLGEPWRRAPRHIENLRERAEQLFQVMDLVAADGLYVTPVGDTGRHLLAPDNWLTGDISAWREVIEQKWLEAATDGEAPNYRLRTGRNARLTAISIRGYDAEVFRRAYYRPEDVLMTCPDGGLDLLYQSVPHLASGRCRLKASEREVEVDIMNAGCSVMGPGSINPRNGGPYMLWGPWHAVSHYADLDECLVSLRQDIPRKLLLDILHALGASQWDIEDAEDWHDRLPRRRLVLPS